MSKKPHPFRSFLNRHRTKIFVSLFAVTMTVGLLAMLGVRVTEDDEEQPNAEDRYRNTRG